MIDQCGETRSRSTWSQNIKIIMFNVSRKNTYDHRTLKTRLPVRSALFKQRTGGLVVRWVTTSEYPLLYVFVLLSVSRDCLLELIPGACHFFNLLFVVVFVESTRGTRTRHANAKLMTYSSFPPSRLRPSLIDIGERRIASCLEPHPHDENSFSRIEG